MKRGHVTIFVIIALLIVVVGVVLSFYYESKEVKDNGEAGCVFDEDCVAASCCHTSSCVSAEDAPDCIGIYCTQVCQPETLDCGQGSCKCVNKECKAVFK